MSDETFQKTVLQRFDDLGERLESIELRVSGSVGDAHNQGIVGKLKAVDSEIVDINKRQLGLTVDVRYMKEDQGKQRAWLKGMAFGLLVTGGTGVVTLARMIGAG